MTESAAHPSGHRKGRPHGCVTQSEPRASASGFYGATPAPVKPRAYAWGSDECRRKCHAPVGSCQLSAFSYQPESYNR